jgi:hypothetical protein
MHRSRQSAVCHPERCGGNPLRRKALSLKPEAVALIDGMANESPESVQDVLCSRLSLHTSRREIESFRQARFREAGGRTAFIETRGLAPIEAVATAVSMEAVEVMATTEAAVAASVAVEAAAAMAAMAAEVEAEMEVEMTAVEQPEVEARRCASGTWSTRCKPQ